MENRFFVKLPHRGLIQIEGEDRRSFLQSLVSHDVGLLDTQPVVYACLLTPQGKFLHDFFIQEGDGVLFLDCEGGARAQDLYKRLLIYRLRARVRISVEEDFPVFGVWESRRSDFRDSGISGKDPRHPAMGWRLFEKPEGCEARLFTAWDEHRLRLGVPDGSRDMVVEKDTLLECRIDRLNGVSF